MTEKDTKLLDTCPACNDPKPIGLAVCWVCFKYTTRFKPLKYYKGSFENWLTMVKNIYEPKPKFEYWHKKQFKAIAIILTIFFIPLSAWAWTNDQLADAIFKAENSKSHPYGILAHYKHTTPRQACLNTIVHAKRDWNGKDDFILFLAKRYAPINSNTDNGTNKFWYKNVMYYLTEKCRVLVLLNMTR